MTDIEKQPYDLYFATERQNGKGPIHCTDLYRLYCSLDDTFTGLEYADWVMFRIEHQGHVIFQDLFSSDIWNATAENYNAFKLYIGMVGDLEPFS